MPTPDEIVRSMCESWNAPTPDPDQISKYFAEDAVYHNIPLEPAVGRAAISATVAGFLAPLDGIHFEIRHQVSSGNIVMNERTDTFHVSGRATPLRVMGVFEVNDGLITAWRDYFDLAQGNQAMGF
ncbi:nuclear transport factor 2 family protein [Streptomyces chartreusis]|uniref:Nuclear transport factor 2 family protein n=1 Tax=Streptomyces chartreusis TaxID=1969 RepID=A0A7H8T0E4_STRCX|nr:limonene-1,2-epoxide hydrolase family protein [Streptomyces chartreusis]QKZ16901.1 nuclear transport factor 2 family protein [Streptomyces chartreusis]